MALFIFARFHAREGDEATVAAALRDVIVPTRAEPGCLAINAFRSIRDPSLFFLHSRWIDETAFDTHAELPHTVAFLQRVKLRIDHPLDVARTGARPPRSQFGPCKNFPALIAAQQLARCEITVWARAQRHFSLVRVSPTVAILARKAVIWRISAEVSRRSVTTLC